MEMFWRTLRVFFFGAPRFAFIACLLMRYTPDTHGVSTEQQKTAPNRCFFNLTQEIPLRYFYLAVSVEL